MTKIADDEMKNIQEDFYYTNLISNNLLKNVKTYIFEPTNYFKRTLKPVELKNGCEDSYPINGEYEVIIQLFIDKASGEQEWRELELDRNAVFVSANE